MADTQIAPTDTPSPAPVEVTDQESALKHINNALQRQATGEAPPVDDPTPQDEDTPVEEPSEEPEQTEGETDEPEADAEDESEPEEESEEPDDEDRDEAPAEVPDTLQGLAEMFDVDPSELAGHIKLDYTDDDGNPQSISFAEAVRGTLRQEDYSQKTQALAQEREVFTNQRNEATQAITEKTKLIDTMATALQQEVMNFPNDAQLMDMLDENSQNYLGSDEVNRIRMSRDNKIRLLQQVGHERQKTVEEQAQFSQQQQSEFRNEQIRRMEQAFPDLKDDPAKQSEFNARVSNFLTDGLPPGFNYTAEQVDQFLSGYNTSQVVILDMAMKYAESVDLGKKLTKKYKGTPRPIKPNASKPRVDKQAKSNRDSLHRLRTEKSPEAAIAHIRNKIRK